MSSNSPMGRLERNCKGNHDFGFSKQKMLKLSKKGFLFQIALFGNNQHYVK